MKNILKRHLVQIIITSLFLVANGILSNFHSVVYGNIFDSAVGNIDTPFFKVVGLLLIVWILSLAVFWIKSNVTDKTISSMEKETRNYVFSSYMNQNLRAFSASPIPELVACKASIKLF